MSSQPLLQTAPGKRISLPLRLEPKVFFANERTFLSWLNFSIILGGLAIGLLNFGDKVGRISAGIFTFVAVLSMGYALWLFHWRAGRIRTRGGVGGGGVGGFGGFDDRFGPTVLTGLLLAAVITNFVLRAVVGENGDEGRNRGGHGRGHDGVVPTVTASRVLTTVTGSWVHTPVTTTAADRYMQGL